MISVTARLLMWKTKGNTQHFVSFFFFVNFARQFFKNGHRSFRLPQLFEEIVVIPQRFIKNGRGIFDFHDYFFKNRRAKFTKNLDKMPSVALIFPHQYHIYSNQNQIRSLPKQSVYHCWTSPPLSTIHQTSIVCDY